jgi:osmoprotectant transport system substrate-binding protein
MGGTKIIAGLIFVVILTGCSRSSPITVGSKNFTEQVILGEIVAQHVEQSLGQRVDRRLNLGGTLLAHQALVNGEIDLYPEYTGTALTVILKQQPSSDANEVFKKVRAEYHARWNIDWLDPLGFNNTFAMVIRGEVARRNHIQTLSEAARYRPRWRLGIGYEFSQRPDGLAGLLDTYHLPLKGSPVSMDLGLLYKALEGNQVDMIAANSTDGFLSVLDVRVLKDDRCYFPPYQAALAVREDALEKHQGLRRALEKLSRGFSDKVMRRLNYEVDAKHRPVSEVAREFLGQAVLAER